MRTTGHQNGHSSVWQATGALLSQVIAHKILRHLRTGKGDGSGVNSSFYICSSARRSPSRSLIPQPTGYSPDADPSYVHRSLSPRSRASLIIEQDLFNTQPIAEMKWDDCVIKADTGYDSREGGDFVDVRLTVPFPAICSHPRRPSSAPPIGWSRAMRPRASRPLSGAGCVRVACRHRTRSPALAQNWGRYTKSPQTPVEYASASLSTSPRSPDPC
jgi:hypothetical protein